MQAFFPLLSSFLENLIKDFLLLLFCFLFMIIKVLVTKFPINDNHYRFLYFFFLYSHLITGVVSPLKHSPDFLSFVNVGGGSESGKSYTLWMVKQEAKWLCKMMKMNLIFLPFSNTHTTHMMSRATQHNSSNS